MEKFLTKNQKSLFITLDVMFIILSYIISSLFLDMFNVLSGTYYFIVAIAFTCAFHCISFECFRVYNIIWLYAGINDYFKVMRIMVLEMIILMVFFHFMPNSYEMRLVLLNGIFSMGFVVASRVAVRLFAIAVSNYRADGVKKKNLLIVGAGNAARTIINDIDKNGNSPYKIVGLTDDNPDKIGGMISGHCVLGGSTSIPKIVKTNAVDEIVIALPSAKESEKKKIIELCKSAGCAVKILPAVCRFEDIQSGMLAKIRDVQIEDLLARDEVFLDNKALISSISGKTVMVTGGGGSIGSELCRQLAMLNPERLIIVDIYENNAYEIQMELMAECPKVELEVLIASVRDEKRMDMIFDKYRPYAVFHAAAHKHVPLMETSPGEAIKNNVFGTFNVSKLADKYGVDRFVLISTDKAVNPTNVMGASKRLCEMIVQAMDAVSQTKFVAVRFGNVLGSNGSVIPLFKSQIQHGGPVTLTHKEITRFFMTIPEAVRLVLQSYTYAEGGEIFVLDMGEPVKIYDLAINLIKLSGLRPYDDIDIKITGLRPGEKLYEELLMAEEGLRKTEHSKIFVGNPTFSDFKVLEKNLKLLKDIADCGDEHKLRSAISEIVPTYHVFDGETAEKTAESSQHHREKATV